MADKTDDLVIGVSTDLSSVQRAIRKLDSEIARASTQIEGRFSAIGKSIDRAMPSAVQDRINAMVGIGTKGAKEWTGALADQGKELERLRAKYSPLFNTINSYKSAVADIKRAHALGAISAEEMTAAISRERQAALASTAAIKGRNAALAQGGYLNGSLARGFQTANIAAQFQDIAVTSAMGMNPLQIALQQGTQLSAVLNTMGNGRQMIAGLGAAFASIVNPVSLVTIGLIAGGAAAVQYFSNLDRGGKRSEEVLQKEAELIAKVVAKWGDALPALKAYNAERERLANQKEIEDATAAGIQQQWDKAGEAIDGLNAKAAAAAGVLKDFGADPVQVTAAMAAWEKLATGIDNHTASADDARDAQKKFADLAKTTGMREVRALAKAFEGLDVILKSVAKSSSSIGLEGRLEAGTASLREIENASLEALEKLRKANADYLKDQERRLSLSRDELELQEEIAKVQKEVSEKGGQLSAKQAEEQARRRIEARQPPTVINSDGNRVAVPTPAARPLVELSGDDKLQKKTETAAQRAANAYRDLIKSADDRIGQIRLETELAGRYGIATDAARFRLELLQQAEDKGRSLSDKQRAEIEQKVSLYEKYSQTLAEVKLQQDLLTAARFSSLSRQDQQIVTTLRQYGLPEDLTGNSAAMIRQSLQQQEVSDGVKTFLSEFTSGVVSGGKSVGEAFADAVRAAAARAMESALDNLFAQIGNAVSRSMMPNMRGGVGASAPFAANTTLGALLGGGATPAASASNMAVYRAAIAQIESGGRYDALGSITRNGDRAYGKYQIMGSNIGPWSRDALGRSISPQEFLSSPSMQDRIFDHRFGGYVDRFGPSGAAQAWFGGPGSVGRGGAGADLHGTTGNSYVRMFETNVARMGGVAAEATKGLGSLNGGLQAIANNFGGAGGGVNLGALFSPSFTPTTTLGNFLQGIPGFDGGGHTGRGSRSGGMDGKGGFLALLHPKETVIDHASVSAPRAPRLRSTGGPRTVRNETSLTVHIDGANGDDHVRMLVRQGVNEAMSQQAEQMNRGGYGNMQDRWAADRG